MNSDIYRKRILITVKTYPTLSKKYDELVCTAGITNEGKWIRIYPVPFRKLNEYDQYKKYDWVEVELLKNVSDSRPESFRPADLPIKIKKIEKVGTEDLWAERKKIVLNNVYNDIEKLIKDNKENTGTSLAVFKPTEIINFFWEETEKEWDKETLKTIEANAKQLNLFDEYVAETFKIVKKLPYKFKFKFKDINGKESTMMIEDWEIGQLYWNCLKKYGNEKIALQKVKDKYFDDFSKKKDLHFFLGTTKKYDKWANNPFIIVGTFHPPFSNGLQQLF